MTPRRILAAMLVTVQAALLLTACASMQAEPAPTLYKRLGGREGIAQVVDEFVNTMAADPRVNARFKGMQPVAIFKLKTNLADQICDAAGGPCSYVGRDLKTTHAGMGITEAEWSAAVDDLTKALDKNKVGAREKQDLLTLLGPMKADIVGR